MFFEPRSSNVMMASVMTTAIVVAGVVVMIAVVGVLLAFSF